jgi:hypothetical protein
VRLYPLISWMVGWPLLNRWGRQTRSDIHTTPMNTRRYKLKVVGGRHLVEPEVIHVAAPRWKRRGGEAAPLATG